MYYSFSCDDLTGEASFQTPNGSFPVIDTDGENRTFTIQVPAENAGNSCNTKNQVVWLNQSLPFRPTNQCYNGHLQNLKSGGIIQIMWEPPPEPTCSTSADCEDWSNSSCKIREGQGQRRCLCNQYYKWDGLALNCTRGVDLLRFGCILRFNHLNNFNSYWFRARIMEWREDDIAESQSPDCFHQSNCWNYYNLLHWLYNLS